MNQIVKGMNERLVEVQELLDEFGGLYDIYDIVYAIQDGHMQSFAYGDSWAVTQICEFPKKKVLDVVFMIGSLNELKELEPKLIEFARENYINYMMANGRRGFIKEAFPGWKMKSATFVRDLNDGS